MTRSFQNGKGGRVMKEVNYAGLKMKNPVIVASAESINDFECMRRARDAGAGAVITKSVVFPKKYMEGMEYVEGRATGQNPRPRYAVVNKDMGFDPTLHKRGAAFTLFRAGGLYLKPDDASRDIEKAKKKLDIPIIGSIVAARDDHEEWQRVAKIVQNAGADALELNMHCIPYFSGTTPEIVKAVKEVAKVPVISKLMVPWEDSGASAKKVEAAGADAVAGLGTFALKAMDIDVDTGKIFLQPSIYGLGGPWLRPVGLAFVANMATSVKIPISGVTGVATWRDVVKYIMVGATTVQVCGAVFAEGYKVLGKIVRGLEEYMGKKGYSSIEDFRGTILKDIIPRTKMPFEPPIKAAVEEPKCIGCEDCADVCFWHALSMKEGVIQVDRKACDGCGLCVSICSHGALSLRPY
jgi:dihydroorotate dehydrogenase/NAD-dependent dihydropyrimidine dehydrogenase PreA subunit